MAKFYGKIGYAQDNDDGHGVHTETIIEYEYCGELIQNSRRLQQSDSINDDIVISNKISIISDPFANKNFHTIRYVEYMGTKWKVSDVEVKYPRLILTLGGVYNA